MSNTTETTDSTAKSRVKPFNEAIRADLEKYREDSGLTLSDLGRELGVSGSAVSKYLGAKPEGDVASLESSAADVLKNAQKRARRFGELFATTVSNQINSIFETIRKTNDVGGITGPAGIGKTCGTDLYLKVNPTAVKMTATRWLRTGDAMLSLLWEAVDTRSYKRNGSESRAQYLVNKFDRSNRLLIFDNAHRLTKGGLEFCFDFHDATGVPICFVGNPEFLDKIADNDQQFSRIGLFRELKLKETRVVANRILDQIAPQFAANLEDMAVQVIERRGHVRSLKKQIVLAKEIFEGAGGKHTIEDAFRSAHTQLVGRDYQLTR